MSGIDYDFEKGYEVLPDLPFAKGKDGSLGPEDAKANIGQYMRGIDVVLKSLNLPPIKDKRKKPKPYNAKGHCVVYLTDTNGIRITHVRYGATQMNGNVYYALNPQWIEKRTDPKTNVSRLYLKEGIVFDSCGHQAYRVRHDPPRLITYFVDEFTLGGTCNLRDDGVPLERGIDTPMCDSHILHPIVDDKLYTRILLACARVGFPATLAFTYKPVVKYDCPEGLRIQVVELEALSGDATLKLIKESIGKWLSEVQGFSQVVVKPSGPEFMQSRGVTFHPVNDPEAIEKAVQELLDCVHEGEAILIDEFLDPLPARTTLSDRDVCIYTAMRGGSMGKDEEETNTLLCMQNKPPTKLGHRLRVVVQRTPGNHARVVQIAGGIADLSMTIGGHNTFVRSFDGFCDVWGIAEGEPRRRVLNEVKAEGRRTLEAIMRMENKMTAEERGGERAQTDSIGLDVILCLKRGVIMPVVIEVNGWDSTSQPQSLEYNIPWKFGETVSSWTNTIQYRSATYLMEGQVLVILSDTSAMVEELKPLLSLEVSCVVVIPSKRIKTELESLAKTDIGDGSLERLHFIVAEGMMQCPEEPAAERIAKEVSAWSEKNGKKVDGVLSYVDVLGRLVHLLSTKLELSTIGGAPWISQVGYFEGILCNAYYPPAYHVLNPQKFCPTYKVVKTKEDMAKVVKEMELPLVFRPNRTTWGMGEKIAFLPETAVQMGEELMMNLQTVCSGSSPAAQVFGKEVIVSEYQDGCTHYVYMVMYQGDIMGGFVMDVAPPNMPSSLSDTAYALPTVLSREAESSLVRLSANILRRNNLDNGTYAFEVQVRAGLPHFHKLNASAGGKFMGDWSEHVFDWNIAVAAAMVACGIPPPRMPPLREDITNTHIAGVLLYPSRHRIHKGTLKNLSEKGVCDIFDMGKREYEVEMKQLGHEHASVLLSCSDVSRKLVKKKLEVALQVLEVDDASAAPNSNWFVENLCPRR